MKIEDLNLDVRAFNAVRRTGCTTVEELKQLLSDDPDAIRMKTGQSTFERIEEALAALPQPVEVVEQNVIVSPEYTRAMELHQMIMADKQIIDNGLYRMGKHLKEMRDGKLYKQHGYQNFEDYCQNAVGFSRRQAHNYIGITENLPLDFVKSTSHFGVEKLSLLAKLDEPIRQEITETVDVESVTVKELKAQITALTAERDENEHAAALLSEELDSAKESLLEKESRIRELENQPVQHDITDVDSAAEIERLKKELEDEQLRVMMAEKSAESKARLAAESVREEYEKKLAEKSPETDENALDEARFNSFRLIFEELVDEMENLLEDMEDDPRIAYVKRLDDYWAKNLLYLKSKGAGA